MAIDKMFSCFYNESVALRKVCQNLISSLKEREKEIIIRRFGLFGKEKETLQAIGNDFGVCRERVRQIEERALEKIKSEIQKEKKVFDKIYQQFKNWGGVKREEILISKEGREIVFLLSLDERFQRKREDEKFFSFWFLKEGNYLKVAQNFLEKLVSFFEKKKKLLSPKEISKIFKIKEDHLFSFLEISKLIGKSEEGLFGLKKWPEVFPKTIRDKIYLVLKKTTQPLHFREIAQRIAGAKVASVHNELIKDSRFVLVGRGIYALREWGYWPGEVKDVIVQILREKGRPMTKEEILQEVKKQRLVKESTILVSLYKKDYFEKDSQGRFYLKTAQI